MGLSRHWTESPHLPEKPLFDFDALAFGLGIKLSGFPPEILEDCAGFEHADRLAAGTIRVNDRGDSIVGRDF